MLIKGKCLICVCALILNNTQNVVLNVIISKIQLMQGNSILLLDWKLQFVIIFRESSISTIVYAH